MLPRRKHSYVLTLCCASCALWGAGHLTNRGVEDYPNEIEHPESQLPSDADERTEFAFARLRYPSPYGYYSWGIDAPKADRQFVQGVRRLTRVHTRSVEQVVSLTDNGIYDYPWIYAVEVGHWDLPPDQ